METIVRNGVEYYLAAEVKGDNYVAKCWRPVLSAEERQKCKKKFIAAVSDYCRATGVGSPEWRARKEAEKRAAVN